MRGAFANFQNFNLKLISKWLRDTRLLVSMTAADEHRALG
jgi:hypothetical protein